MEVEPEIREGEVASPCIGVCQVDGENVCLGCGRTLAEIGAWLKADAGQRRRILERAGRRRATREAPDS